MSTPKQIGYYPRVLLAFARLNNAQLVPFVRNVVTQMTSNPNYLNPQPNLADITTAVDLLEASATEASNGGRVLIATRNANRESLLVMVRALAAYVTSVCQEDVLILLTSGFEPARVPTPVGMLPAPQNLRLSYNGMSGQLLFRFDAVKNAANYTIETSEGVAGPWVQQGLSTAARTTLQNLTPGKNYWVRSCANGTAGASEWSVPSLMMAV